MFLSIDNCPDQGWRVKETLSDWHSTSTGRVIEFVKYTVANFDKICLVLNMYEIFTKQKKILLSESVPPHILLMHKKF